MLTVRPAGPGDARDICALLNRVDLLETGRPATDPATVTADLNHPGTDLALDSWLALDSGRPVGWALLRPDGAPDRLDADHYVLPGRPELGLRLLTALEHRARTRARALPGARVRLRQGARTTFDPGHLALRGWRPVRRHQAMVRALDPARDLPPAPAPPGPADAPRLRHCAGDPEDPRRAHALVEETFADHFGHRPRSFERWLDAHDAHDLDWSLVWLVARPGGPDLGVLVARDDRAAMGWIDNLGVRAGERGRGLGTLLLRHAFAALAARGRGSVGLDVDTENSTGAVGLYERVGMRVHHAVDTWELPLTP
ncbi:GNAT family N-acetyltransferase [Streptomyces sp. BI20]|uniref:GNAT family N-acetyltransferase n=1 Tax=Streptomyces sp. BI20 TaxID=3403460 RepID=UPI003C750CC3